MDDTFEGPAIVTVGAEQATVTFPNGTTQTIEREVFLKSSTLRRAPSADVEIPVPETTLRSWLEWLQVTADNVSSASDHSTGSLTNEETASKDDVPHERIAQYLRALKHGRELIDTLTLLVAGPSNGRSAIFPGKAASFLGDQESLRSLCKLASEYFMIPDSSQPEGTDKSNILGIQILQDLPEDLQRSVLTHTTAPCVQLFAILPEEYHSTALNAKYASIVHDNAICVSARDVLLEGQWDAFWNLVSAQPFLKRVEIKMFQSPRQLIAPLNGMRAVTHLTINKVEWSRLSDGRGGVWPLGNLTSLEHLDLAKNEIDGDHANALARQLRMLTSLQHLNLHKNSLGSKGVQRLSRCFSHLPLLRHLDLGRNNIGTEGIEELVLPLADVTQLTFLSFYDKYTSDSEDHFSAIVLSKMQNLQHMRVLGSVWPKRYIFPHLCVFSSLQHLDIFGNETVSSTSWESANESEAEKFSAVIARELTHLTHLTHLALKFAMVEADVETLGPCLRKMPKLSSIDISGSELGDQEFTAMLRHISEVGSLRRLLLADVNVGEPGVLALEKYLQVAPESLQELSFWAVDDLSREGLRALTSGLQRIRCLQKLDLYNMTWDNDFTGIIADALPALSALKELNLSSCGLYDVDILILAPSISRLTFLQELTVGRNSFGEAGVDLLASNLSNLSRLRCLSLRETSLGSTGGRSLKTYLCDLPVLQLLDLKRSDIQEEGVDALIQLLQLNTALECLYMPSIIANVRRSMFARVNYGLRRVHGWGRHGVGRLARWTFFPNILLRMDSLPPLSDTGSENLRIPAQLINRDRSNEQFNCRALWISVSDSFYSLVQSILTRG